MGKVTCKMKDGSTAKIGWIDLGTVMLGSNGVLRRMLATRFTINGSWHYSMVDEVMAQREGNPQAFRMAEDFEHLELWGVDVPSMKDAMG